MLFPSIILALLASSVTISSFAPSDEALRLAYDRGQRFYVIEDYRQAIEKFEVVKQAEDSRFVDETKVLIEVGELNFPVKVAATFQLANSHSNQAVNLLEKADLERKPARVEELRQQAREHFKKAADNYKEASQITDLRQIRVLSQYRLVKTYFRSKEYEKVISLARQLVAEFPESEFVDGALYELGWAHFQRREYDGAVAAFEELTLRDGAAYRVDRAQFQIGVSYYEQGLHPQARQALKVLIAKYDFSDLSEAERVKMEAQKLSGVVKETALELVAKAHLMVGDSYSAEGNVSAATEAYRRVITGYPQERALVEKAYVKIGDAYFAVDDIEGGVQIYRRAIDEVSESGFRARMQARIGRRYYEARQFPSALEEYLIYTNAYGDAPVSGGLEMDRARFQVAQCYLELAEASRGEADGGVGSAEYYGNARQSYLQVVEDYPGTELGAESLFGAGFSTQRRDQEGDLDLALELFEEIAREHGDRPDVLARAQLQTARIHYRKADFEGSAALYEEYLRIYPENAGRDQTLLELALAYRDARRYDEATASLDRIPPTSAMWTKAGIMGGEFLLRDGRLEKAEELLLRGFAVSPENLAPAELYYVLARVYFEQGLYDAAAGAFGSARKNSADDVITLGSLLGRGTSHFQGGDVASAIPDLEELLRLNPPLDMKDHAHRLLAQCYVRTGRKAEAIVDYEAIIAVSDDETERAEFTLLLAELYYSLERYREAVAQCQSIVDSDFQDSAADRGYLLEERALFVMGDAHGRLDEHDGARRIFDEALIRFPKSSLRADLLFGKAVSSFALGDAVQVIPLLNNFIDEFPGNPNVENAYYLLAYSHLQQTDFAAAAEWFGLLVERFPRSGVVSEALFQRGENLFNLRRFEEATTAYKRVVTDYPQSDFVDNSIYNLAWCYFELERQEDAVKRFEDLLARFPTSPLAPSAQFTIGDYYFNGKDYDTAARMYRQVIEDHPESEMATEAQGLLAEVEEIQAYLKYENAMSLFDQKVYDQAATALEEIISTYEGTETRAGAMANLGMSYEFLHKWKDAAKVYGNLLESYREDPASASAVVFADEHLGWIVKNRL